MVSLYSTIKMVHGPINIRYTTYNLYCFIGRLNRHWSFIDILFACKQKKPRSVFFFFFLIANSKTGVGIREIFQSVKGFHGRKIFKSTVFNAGRVSEFTERTLKNLGKRNLYTRWRVTGSVNVLERRRWLLGNRINSRVISFHLMLGLLKPAIVNNRRPIRGRCKEMFHFCGTARSAVTSIQPPIKWVRRALPIWIQRRVREADRSPPCSAEVNEWVALYFLPPPPYTTINLLAPESFF